eukprot:464660-Prymnesium_polylepis.1
MSRFAVVCLEISVIRHPQHRVAERRPEHPRTAARAADVRRAAFRGARVGHRARVLDAAEAVAAQVKPFRGRLVVEAMEPARHAARCDRQATNGFWTGLLRSGVLHCCCLREQPVSRVERPARHLVSREWLAWLLVSHHHARDGTGELRYLIVRAVQDGAFLIFLTRHAEDAIHDRCRTIHRVLILFAHIG